MARRIRELRDRKSALSLQFSLRALLLMMFGVAVSVLIVREVHAWFGAAYAAVMILTVLSIFAHVAGAALGGRLRASKDVELRFKTGEASDVDGEEIESRLLQPMEAQQADFARQTQLSEQRPLNLEPIYYFVGVGAVFCAIAASVVLIWYMWDSLAIVNVLFGAASAAMIGGLFGFLAGSLYQVVRSALSEAQKDARR